jgi:hypothetical protein
MLVFGFDDESCCFLDVSRSILHLLLCILVQLLGLVKLLKR